MRDAHRKAADQHELAGHAHRPVAKHPERGNSAAGSWHSERTPKRQVILLLLVIGSLALLAVPAKGQSLPDSKDASGAVANTTPAQPDLP